MVSQNQLDEDSLDKPELENGGSEKPDPDKIFEIQIDRLMYKLKENRLTGADLRRVPEPPISPERDLFEIVPGHSDRKVEDDDRIIIRDGLRFFTAPNTINPASTLSATEQGAITMSLPELDITYLNERGIAHEIVLESGMTCVVIPQWPLPKGFDRDASDLLIRLSPGYPDVHPGMWWFCPAVHRADGRELPNTNVVELYLGRTWQTLVATLQ